MPLLTSFGNGTTYSHKCFLFGRVVLNFNLKQRHTALHKCIFLNIQTRLSVTLGHMLLQFVRGSLADYCSFKCPATRPWRRTTTAFDKHILPTRTNGTTRPQRPTLCASLLQSRRLSDVDFFQKR